MAAEVSDKGIKVKRRFQYALEDEHNPHNWLV